MYINGHRKRQCLSHKAILVGLAECSHSPFFFLSLLTSWEWSQKIFAADGQMFFLSCFHSANLSYIPYISYISYISHTSLISHTSHTSLIHLDLSRCMTKTKTMFSYLLLVLLLLKLKAFGKGNMCFITCSYDMICAMLHD